MTRVLKKNNITGPFLLFVGRLVEKKGVKYAIAAMPITLKKYPDAKFLIIGEGPLEKDLKKQVEELKETARGEKGFGSSDQPS